VRDRDPRDFTVHRSSYKAPEHSSGFFQRANEPKGSGARGGKKKEQLRCSQGNGALKARHNGAPRLARMILFPCA